MLKERAGKKGWGVEVEGWGIMKILPEPDFLNHCMSLFLLIGDNYRMLISFMQVKEKSEKSGPASPSVRTLLLQLLLLLKRLLLLLLLYLEKHSQWICKSLGSRNTIAMTLNKRTKQTKKYPLVVAPHWTFRIAASQRQDRTSCARKNEKCMSERKKEKTVPRNKT